MRRLGFWAWLCLGGLSAVAADRVCLEAESSAPGTAPMRVVNALDATNAGAVVAGTFLISIAGSSAATAFSRSLSLWT